LSSFSPPAGLFAQSILLSGFVRVLKIFAVCFGLRLTFGQ
jgi:hypothetical protein